MAYDWDFSIFSEYLPALTRGTIVTIELSVLSSLIGTILGIPLAIVLRNKHLRWVLLPVNDSFRAIPALVLMLLFFYFPYQEILGISPLSSFTCALFALVFAQTVFTADIIRAALNNIPNNSIVGAKSLGLKRKDIIKIVIIPEVVRQTLPTMVAFYIGNIKLSCLASAINAEELLFTAKLISSQKQRTLEAWIIVTIVFILLVLPLTIISRRMEKSRWLRHQG